MFGLRLLHSVLPLRRGGRSGRDGGMGVSEEVMDWRAAKGHYDAVRAEYEALQGLPNVNTTLALRLVFEPLAVRYNNGDRSRDLYSRMMSVK